MSYSFTIKVATKALAMGAIISKLDEVVVAQPVHAADRAAAEAAAIAYVDLLGEDPACDVEVNVYGSVWSTDAGLRSTNIGVNAQLVPRPAPAD